MRRGCLVGHSSRLQSESTAVLSVIQDFTLREISFRRDASAPCIFLQASYEVLRYLADAFICCIVLRVIR